MAETRSPIREKPLHVPGQTLDVTIARLWDDRGFLYIFMLSTVTFAATFDWVRTIYDTPPRPWVTTVFAAIVAAFCLRGILRIRRQTKLLEQGRDGERAVGEALDELREDGCRVFHDIMGDGSNVDHVVLSTRGIFVVETKTISKPPRGTGSANVRVEGDRILAGGADLGSGPIIQAKANARWLFGLLKESTGKTYPVKPCVVFPGWFVERVPKDVARKVWVLSPKGLTSFIRHERVRVEESDLHMAAYHLSRYIRSPWAPPNGGFAAKVLAQGRGRRANVRSAD